MVKKSQIWQALKQTTFPGFKNRNLFGIVKGLTVDEAGNVTLRLAIEHFGSQAQEAIIQTARDAVLVVSGVTALEVEVIAMQPPAEANPQRPHIDTVIAVGSGKGGVGKSTMAVNIAVGLAQEGLKVGLMDADIFGPNIPRMLGVEELPARNGKMIVPAEAYGVKLVSVGFLVDPNRAVIWRGPMTDKILRQFLFGVEWGTLDVLVVDLPPGTGDIAISLAKHAEPDGAIAVVTPQDVALDDARKAISMFRKLSTPMLGVIENMSYFICSTCDSRHTLFGEGGAARLADDMDVELLGQIPMEPHVRQGGDEGKPAVLRQESGAGAALMDVVRQIMMML